MYFMYFISASWNLFNELFFFCEAKRVSSCFQDRCRSVLLTVSCFIRGIKLWGRWHYYLVAGAFILQNDMPFAKFCGLRVYGCDFYWLFEFSMEVTLSKLPQPMRDIQMLNQETANRLSNYLCTTPSQDCQILHILIWEDFNALSSVSLRKLINAVCFFRQSVAPFRFASILIQTRASPTC
jgi:hypothetical protein